jgi:predicted phosphatase
LASLNVKRVKIQRQTRSSARKPSETRLKEELKRLQGMLNAGRELEVVWSPKIDSNLSGEVKGKVIYIYEPDEDKAIEALRHEFIDYFISQAIEPYKSVANKLIQLLNEIAYKKKEEVVESLVKLLS